MTAAVDRPRLRERHGLVGDIQPARDGQVCVHATWAGSVYQGPCRLRAAWLVLYGELWRPECEHHTLGTITRRRGNDGGVA